MKNDNCRISSSRSDRGRRCRNANDVIGATGASSRSVQLGAEREAPQQKRPTLGKVVSKPLPSRGVVIFDEDRAEQAIGVAQEPPEGAGCPSATACWAPGGQGRVWDVAAYSALSRYPTFCSGHFVTALREHRSRRRVVA